MSLIDAPVRCNCPRTFQALETHVSRVAHSWCTRDYVRSMNRVGDGVRCTCIDWSMSATSSRTGVFGSRRIGLATHAQPLYRLCCDHTIPRSYILQSHHHIPFTYRIPRYQRHVRLPTRKTVVHFGVQPKMATDLGLQPTLWKTVVHFGVQLKTVVHFGVQLKTATDLGL